MLKLLVASQYTGVRSTLYSKGVHNIPDFNSIKDGPFRGWSQICRGVGANIHTYPTMMKLGTVIPYLKKISKIYESRDTPLYFS